MSTKRKRGLGRGLDALIEEAPAPVQTLPVSRLRPNRFQPRTEFDEDRLQELAESIRSQGVVQPIVVTADPEGDGYQIVAGERRWRAAQRAGLDQVPVAIRQVADDQELLELALVENLQRSDLNPVEEAEAYRLLRDTFELSQEQIARRVGKSRSTVANALRLLNLPEAVREMLRDQRLTAGQARPLLSLDDPDQQVELAQAAVVEGLTARQLERTVRGEEPAETGAADGSGPGAAEGSAPAGKKKPGKKGEPTEIYAAAAQETLTQRLQTRVEIRRRGKGGIVRLHFHSEEELMRIYDLLMERGGAR